MNESMYFLFKTGISIAMLVYQSENFEEFPFSTPNTPPLKFKSKFTPEKLMQTEDEWRLSFWGLVGHCSLVFLKSWSLPISPYKSTFIEMKRFFCGFVGISRGPQTATGKR